MSDRRGARAERARAAAATLGKAAGAAVGRAGGASRASWAAGVARLALRAGARLHDEPCG